MNKIIETLRGKLQKLNNRQYALEDRIIKELKKQADGMTRYVIGFTNSSYIIALPDDADIPGEWVENGKKHAFFLGSYDEAEDFPQLATTKKEFEQWVKQTNCEAVFLKERREGHWVYCVYGSGNSDNDKVSARLFEGWWGKND